MIRISNSYIAEMYYMDLDDDKWMDANKDYKFDMLDHESILVESWEKAKEQWEGIPEEELKVIAEIIVKERLYHTPEIWTSRIMASALTGSYGSFPQSTEAKLVNSYLKKNYTAPQ